jgi:hypothetical protein
MLKFLPSPHAKPRSPSRASAPGILFTRSFNLAAKQEQIGWHK